MAFRARISRSIALNPNGLQHERARNTPKSDAKLRFIQLITKYFEKYFRWFSGGGGDRADRPRSDRRNPASGGEVPR